MLFQVAIGYPGEIQDKPSGRWLYWALAMIPFLFVVAQLAVGGSHIDVLKVDERITQIRCQKYVQDSWMGPRLCFCQRYYSPVFPKSDADFALRLWTMQFRHLQ